MKFLLIALLFVGCAPEEPKCVQAELLYRTYWNGYKWAYYPVSVCTKMAYK